MLRAISALSVLALLGAPFASTGWTLPSFGTSAAAAEVSVDALAVAEGELLFVSWNIENFFDRYDDPFRRDEVTKPAFVNDARQKRVAGVLRELNADVVALQEVENRFLLQSFVDEHLADMNYQVVLVEGNDSRGIDCAVLSRVPVQAVTSYMHRRFMGRDGMSYKFQRDLLRVQLGAPFHGDVYVVHLKSQHGDEAANIVREAEASEIVKIVQENAAGRGAYRAVVMGDFNEVDDMPTLEILREGGLIDPMAGTDRYTYNKEPYLTRIDYSLLSAQMASEVSAAQVVNQLAGHKLETSSDHYPLRFEWKPSADE